MITLVSLAVVLACLICNTMIFFLEILMEMPDKGGNITERRYSDSADNDSADNDNRNVQVSNDEFDHGRTYFVEKIHIPRYETDEDKVPKLIFIY